jgi:hypothetical protein
VCVWSLMCKRVDRKGRRGSGGIPSVCVLYIEQRRSDTYRVLVGRKSREGGKAKGGGGEWTAPARKPLAFTREGQHSSAGASGMENGGGAECGSIR